LFVLCPYCTLLLIARIKAGATTTIIIAGVLLILVVMACCLWRRLKGGKGNYSAPGGDLQLDDLDRDQ
jgi:hypothetical protein